MAAAFDVLVKDQTKAGKLNIVEMTLDGSYAAGGYPVTPANLGLDREIQAVFPIVATLEGVLPVYDPATKKIALYKGASTVTVTSGNAEFTQLATNDSIISASSKLHLLVYGDAPHTKA